MLPSIEAAPMQPNTDDWSPAYEPEVAKEETGATPEKKMRFLEIAA